MDTRTRNERWAVVAMVMALALVWSGCETTQSVVDIRQHPTQDVTVIHTVQQGWMDSGHRFWHCVREGDELVCDVVCGDGEQDEVQCPQQPGLIRANRSAAAQLGTPTAVATDEADPAPTDPADQEQEPAEEPELEEDDELVDDEGGEYQ